MLKTTFFQKILRTTKNFLFPVVPFWFCCWCFRYTVKYLVGLNFERRLFGAWLMLDIKIVREHPEIIQKDLQKRGEPWKTWDAQQPYRIRQTMAKVTDRSEWAYVTNVKWLTAEVANLKKQKKDASKQIQEATNYSPANQRNWKTKVGEYREKTDSLLMKLPNILHDSVPFGTWWTR